MRIYKRADFLKLPPGTAYCKGEKWAFAGLVFKGESLGNDWYETNPAWVDGEDSWECFDRLEKMLNSGASYPMQNSECRDGLFESDALFLVLERDDLLQLHEWINTAASLCTRRKT